MTSWFPAEALRPNSPQVAVLKAFLAFIDNWERHANSKGKGGFLSKSTATGLRVTISSTLELLAYLTGKLKFKFLMTSKLCQDPLENLFGIITQSSGNNEHPTPSQFLPNHSELPFILWSREMHFARKLWKLHAGLIARCWGCWRCWDSRAKSHNTRNCSRSDGSAQCVKWSLSACSEEWLSTDFPHCRVRGTKMRPPDKVRELHSHPYYASPRW